ncbi:hypothetical protein Btru_041125 [Bulinus truncatus]|nr:hypothetical protein Btru_041125 [Bulinus truncatus]
MKDLMPATYKQGHGFISKEFIQNYFNSSKFIGKENNLTIISNQSPPASTSTTEFTCTQTVYVRCHSKVTDESITNETFGISLQRRPVWIDTSIFFNFSKCQYSKCYFQNDHINESTRMVIVEIVEMDDGFKPAKRWPHQLYVAAVWESPFFTFSSSLNNRNSYWNNRFNLTSSYRTHSDIFVPYGYLEFKPKPVAERPSYYEIAKNKTKWVIWYVSNCDAPSLRDKYVKEMQKTIHVDIYGRCGKPCPLNSFQCSKTFYTEYRFYLSFENSLCKDYMTEKFLKLFRNNTHIIPVVRGGFDYDKYLPTNTFIDSSHFKNATNLAQFLKRLGEDPLAYSKYLEHKDRYRITDDSGLDNLGCQACKYLHTKKLEGNVRDLKKQLVDDHCKEPKDV